MADDKIEAREELEAELKETIYQADLLKRSIDKQEEHPRDIEKIKKKIEDMNEYIFLNDRKIKLELEIYKIKAQEEYENFFHEVCSKLENDIEVTSDDITKLLLLKSKSLDSKEDEEVSKIFNEAKGEDDKEAVDKYLQYITNAPELSELLNLIKEQQEKHRYAPKETPSKTTMTIDKISNQLRLEAIEYGQIYPLKMESRGQQKEITTHVKLEREDIQDLLPDKINDDDIRTMNAVMTLYHSYHIKKASLNEIYRVKIGDSKANPNKRQREELKNQLIALSKTYIQIDCKDERDHFNYEGLSSGEYGGHILDLHYFTGEKRGNETTIFRIHGISPLFDYALAKKQIIEIPFQARENTLTKTLRIQQLEEYLFKRIKQMNNPNNKMGENKYDILVDTIIKNIDFNYKSKKAESNARTKLNQDTEEILKGFKREGFIKDYDPIGKGRRKFYKWKITL